MHTSDVLIAGAGIIGLSAALELAAMGLSVIVLEQGEALREASWAAAGMLAAHDPENPSELHALSDLSIALYPSFLSRLEMLSGLRIPLRTAGTLQSLGHGRRTGMHRGGRIAQVLTHEVLRSRLPDLEPGAHSFIWLEEHSLDPRDICRALPLAIQAAGVTLCEHTAVRSVEQAGDKLRIYAQNADTGLAEFAARHYLHCCGAGARQLEMGKAGAHPRQILPGAQPLPVEPRKGQVLAVTLAADAPALPFVLRTPEIYLVPRGDGRVIVGATVERAGFDRSLTQSAKQDLLAAASALWPPILSGKVTEHWAGLRPGTPDGLPIIDSLALPDPAAATADRAGASAWVATGHFRNGILLAPGTARLLRQLVLRQPLEADIEAFRLARFAAVAAAP